MSTLNGCTRSLEAALGLRWKDKEASRLRAQQLFPSADLRLKKHHGRAEALLLAAYGQPTYTGESGLTGTGAYHKGLLPQKSCLMNVRQ